ncbi:MAG: hypothetical protein ACK4IT_04780 [Thioalkalivibrionaceae bacterium]
MSTSESERSSKTAPGATGRDSPSLDSEFGREPPASEGALRWRERFAWMGMMLFFVLMLAIYLLRGAGLEEDLKNANRELLQTQTELLRLSRGDVVRPVELGLTREDLVAFTRRGIARPEDALREALRDAPDSVPYAPLASGEVVIDPNDFHVLSDRWLVVGLRAPDGSIDGDGTVARLLLEFRFDGRTPSFELLGTRERQ